MRKTIDEYRAAVDHLRVLMHALNAGSAPSWKFTEEEQTSQDGAERYMYGQMVAKAEGVCLPDLARHAAVVAVQVGGYLSMHVHSEGGCITVAVSGYYPEGEQP